MIIRIGPEVILSIGKKVVMVNGVGYYSILILDTEYGIANAYQNNTLQFALEPNGPGWPNPPWSTLFLRKLLENNSFKNDFINYFADLSNTNFKPVTVVNKINSMASVIQPEILRHSTRWNQFTLQSMANKRAELEIFCKSIVLDYMQNTFYAKI